MQKELSQAVEDAVTRAFGTHNASPWKNSEQAAIYLGDCKAGTLKQWRARGEGPKYHVMNEKLVRYHVADLDAFVRGEVRR